MKERRDEVEKEREHGEMRRYVALMLFVALALGLYVARLAQWQLVEGEAYEEISKDLSTQFIRLNAARGEILDSDGKVLVGNELTYGVTFNAMTMAEDRNPTLIRLLNIFKERGESWIDNFPILLDEEGNYVFDERLEGEIAYLKGKAFLNLQEYATADDCMKALIAKYNCKGYAKEDIRDLLSVRYSMHKEGFSRTKPYTIANDISPETIGILSERHQELPGVDTKVFDSRYYREGIGSLASHIIGTMGAITQQQYEDAREADNLFSGENVSGYSLEDRLGQSGVELAFEEELRGHYGKEVMVTDNNGNVTSSTIEEPAKSGNTIKLTLRTDLQEVANDSLLENIWGNVNSTRATAGAAVMVDVKTGGVLVSATYPTFDVELYNTDTEYYNQLVTDTNRPLFDRASSGVFTPGSVFKPLVAIAALEEEVIAPETTYICGGKFNFGDSVFGCMGTHGGVNVEEALCHSCNIFFYQTGYNLDIVRMNAYAEYFGLGQKTGIEIWESPGVMSSPEQYLEKRKMDWPLGNTVQTAIGQLDTTLTPLQLAVYTATIANNGVRYQAHLLDEVIDYMSGETVREFQPVEVKNAKVSPRTMSVVKEGMRMAGRYGTGEKVFADYPVDICVKTGTAETGKEAHLTFIAFAPAEDPEVAVSVVMEYGNKGEYAMNVAKDLLDAYFGLDDSGETDDGEDGPDSGKGDRTAGRSDESGSETDDEGWDGDAPQQDQKGTAQTEPQLGVFYDPEKDPKKIRIKKPGEKDSDPSEESGRTESSGDLADSENSWDPEDG